MTDRQADEAEIAGDTKVVALVLEVDLDAAIETVWRALTDPAIVARWLFEGDIAPEAGRRFAFAAPPSLGGAIACEVLESDPPSRLVYRWGIASGGADRQETVVSFDLALRPEGGTHLRLVHDGFRVPAAYPVDRVAAPEEAMIVLLPLPVPAVARRRIRRARRPVFRRGMAPTMMASRALRLAA